ncbi:FHA domain-containing protein [Calidifontibacter terrae]
MSNENDPRYTHPQGASPAQIVWHSDAPATTPAWQGPGAFSAEPAAAEPAAPQPPASSLSTAWATSSTDDSSASAPDAPAQWAPSAPAAASTSPAAPEAARPTDDVAAPAAPQDPWVKPGAADTAEEVHRDWTDRNGDLAPSTQTSQQNAPAPHTASPYAEPQQQNAPSPYADQDRNAPATSWSDEGNSGSSWADRQAPAAPAAPPAPYAGGPAGAPAQGSQSSTAYDPYARPREETIAPAQGGQDPQGAQDAWAAHHAQNADSPMAEDPAQGDAIPAPPQNDAPSSAEPASDEDALSIGRGRENSIVLDDMLVSRKHIRITADDQGLLLEDLGSRNGTYVNGQRVDRAHLEEGDRIGVGATTFEVRDGWLVTI